MEYQIFPIKNCRSSKWYLFWGKTDFMLKQACIIWIRYPSLIRDPCISFWRLVFFWSTSTIPCDLLRALIDSLLYLRLPFFRGSSVPILSLQWCKTFKNCTTFSWRFPTHSFWKDYRCRNDCTGKSKAMDISLLCTIFLSRVLVMKSLLPWLIHCLFLSYFALCYPISHVMPMLSHESSGLPLSGQSLLVSPVSQFIESPNASHRMYFILILDKYKSEA